MYRYIYIYIYIERQRYIYIYIYIYVHSRESVQNEDRPPHDARSEKGSLCLSYTGVWEKTPPPEKRRLGKTGCQSTESEGGIGGFAAGLYMYIYIYIYTYLCFHTYIYNLYY